MKRLLTPIITPLVALSMSYGSAIAAEKPNIIFIFCDDLGYGDIGVFYQNQRAKDLPRLHTPNIDSLAKDGIQLRHHYCPAPVCAPSRASLFLGQHQGNAPIRNNQFDKALPDHPTLASTLKQAGYHTALIGKWGLQGKGNSSKTWDAYPTKRGFDYFLGGVRHRDGHEHYPFDQIHFKNKKAEVWHNDKQINAGLKGCYTTDLFTAASKKWIIDHQKASPKKPFFLFLSYDTPHAATQIATSPYPKGGGVNGGLQWIGKPGKMINTANDKPNSYLHPDYEKKDWQTVYKRFASSIRRIDNAVGDIRKTLADLKIEKDTLIIFTSDNGPSKESYIKQRLDPSFFDSFGPFTGIKRDCFEGGIRVGAIASWPAKIKPNSISTSPSQMHDWLPTFCEISGAPTPALTDGVSIVPTLTDQKNQTPSTIYTEYAVGGTTPKHEEFPKARRGNKRGQMQAIRIGKYKAIRYQTADANTPFMVFDVVADPQESTDLAGKKGVPTQSDWEKAVSRVHLTNVSAKRPYDGQLIGAVAAGKLKSGAVITAAEKDNASKHYVSTSAHKVTGYVKISKKGNYTFGLPKGMAGVLKVHNILALNTESKMSNYTAAKLNLEAGYHPFTLYLKEKPKASPLHYAAGADGELTLIPADLLFHKE